MTEQQGVVEDVDFFAQEALASAPTDFIPSRGEIVTTSNQAQVFSEDEKKRRLALCFPDIPEAERSERFFEQKAWLAPTMKNEKDVESFIETYSEGLLEPHKCIIVGTNGNFSFAIFCKDREGMPEFKLPQRDKAEKKQDAPADAAPKDAKAALREKIRQKKAARNGNPLPKESEKKKQEEEEDSKQPINDFIKKLDESFDQYARTNDCFARKLIEHRLVEQTAFYRLHMHVINNIHSKVELLNLELRLADMVSVDYGLRDPVARLGVKIAERKKLVPNEPKKKKKQKPFYTEERPGNTYASVLVFAPQAQPPPQQKDALLSSRFSLLVCRTPLDGVRPHWKDVGIQISAQDRTVPHVAFNDTHLAIMCQHQGGDFVVTFYELPPAAAKGKIELKKVGERTFQLPVELGRDSMISTHLGPEGIFAVAIGKGALLMRIDGEEMEMPVPAAREQQAKGEEPPPPSPKARAPLVCFLLEPFYNHEPKSFLAEPATSGGAKIIVHKEKAIKPGVMLNIGELGSIFVTECHSNMEDPFMEVHFKSTGEIEEGATAPIGTKVTLKDDPSVSSALLNFDFVQPLVGETDTIVLASETASWVREGKEIYLPTVGYVHVESVNHKTRTIKIRAKIRRPAGLGVFEDERRQVTSVTTQDGLILLGTKQGEVYGIRRSTGIVEHCNYMPALEPIFAAKMNHERIVMQTVMSTTFNLDARGENVTVIAADRPIGFDMCGTIIAFVNKYGLIKLYDLNTARVCKDFSPPIQGARTPLLQCAYPAIKVFRKKIVVVYPSGVVRVIEQTVDSLENVKQAKKNRKQHKRNKI